MCAPKSPGKTVAFPIWFVEDFKALIEVTEFLGELESVAGNVRRFARGNGPFDS